MYVTCNSVSVNGINLKGLPSTSNTAVTVKLYYILARFYNVSFFLGKRNIDCISRASLTTHSAPIHTVSNHNHSHMHSHRSRSTHWTTTLWPESQKCLECLWFVLLFHSDIKWIVHPKLEIHPFFYTPICRWRLCWHFFLNDKFVHYDVGSMLVFFKQLTNFAYKTWAKCRRIKNAYVPKLKKGFLHFSQLQDWKINFQNKSWRILREQRWPFFLDC